MTTLDIPEQPTFTLAEVAELTGFTEGSLWEGCRAGRIRHQHYGRQRVLTREQLIEFLAATEVRVATPTEPADPDAVRIEEHRRRHARRLTRGRGAA